MGVIWKRKLYCLAAWARGILPTAPQVSNDQRQNDELTSFKNPIDACLTWRSQCVFEYRDSQVVGALVNAVFLVALCFSIFVDAMKRFLEMEEIRNPKLILVVGSVGLTINLVREVMKTFPIILINSGWYVSIWRLGARSQSRGRAPRAWKSERPQ